MRSICSQILKDITFMAEHRLMDYSLLLITENNPDFKERLGSDAASSRNESIKSVGNALRPEINPLLKR